VNPKFEDAQYFRHANGQRFLEVCGPINFETGDLMAIIKEIEIQDGQGTTKKFDVKIEVGACDTMWEVDLTDHVKVAALHAGPGAAGTASATVTKRIGDPAEDPNQTTPKSIQWTGTFELIDPPSFLADRLPQQEVNP
jgi:hypothetical protein